MPFQPGHKLAKGRPKGVPNALTASIKDMVLGALQDVGGRRYLAERAIDQPVAFMALVGRVLPLQIASEGGGPVVIDVSWAPAVIDAPTPAIELEPEQDKQAAD